MMAEPLRLPSQQTLNTYGLSEEEWLAYIPIVGGVHICSVCLLPPRTGRFVVDHEHVRGWTAMLTARRKRYVRGVVCITCNHYILTRFSNPEKHRNAADYLEAYQDRRDAWLAEAKNHTT